MKRSFRMILLMLLIALSAGCGGGSDSSTLNPDNLPVETRLWLDDGTGFKQFYTNDPDLCNHGYWARYNTTYDPMDTVETEVKKVFGNPDYGFGILFCFEQIGTEIHYYRLLITIDGYYSLGKTVTNTSNGATNTTIIPDSKNNNPDPEYLLTFVPSDLLKQGYNVPNIIKVVQSNPGSFEIYFNNSPAANFSDNSFTRGMYGFYAAVGKPSEEKFPNTPVDVRFKQQIPDPAAAQSSTLRSQSIQKGMTWGVESL